MPINSGKISGSDLKSGHLIFLISFLLLSSSGNAQIEFQRYTTATDTFYWKRYAHVPKPSRVKLGRFSARRSDHRIETFFSRQTGQITQFTDDSTNRQSPESLKKYLYPVEINGDDLTDMIFSGFSAGEPEMVRIWINLGDSFDLVFEDYQYISKFVRAGNTLVEMQTGDVGSGDDYLYFTRDYRVHFENGEPVFVKGRQAVIYRYTEEPLKYYPHPVPFIAKADTMLVRASAARLDEPFNPHLGTFGNIVAKYRSRARGFALAYKSCGKGNDWFFVEISPSATPSASILYDTGKIPTFIRGWVPGQAILLE